MQQTMKSDESKAESIASDDLGASDDESHQHVLEPGFHGEGRKCLLWACKACKKKTVSTNGHWHVLTKSISAGSANVRRFIIPIRQEMILQ